MLTFREVIQAVVRNGGTIGTTIVRTVMDDFPLTCTPETDIDEVRRMMLQRHARYMPVMNQRTLMGVISFYDVAKAVVDCAGLREPHAQGLHPRLAGRGGRGRQGRVVPRSASTGERAEGALARQRASLCASKAAGGPPAALRCGGLRCAQAPLRCSVPRPVA